MNEAHAVSAAATRPVAPTRAPTPISARRPATERSPAASRPLVFLYSGNGSQWAGMGRELLEAPAFRARLEAVDRHLAPLAGWSVREALAAPGAALDVADPNLAQPLLFALQVGWTAELAERGLHPTMVLGHSVGEIAAAHVAGAIDLVTALRIVVHRSRLQAREAGRGLMTHLALPEAELRQRLAELGLADEVSIAAVNGPRSVVLSGAPRAIEAVESALGRRTEFLTSRPGRRRLPQPADGRGGRGARGHPGRSPDPGHAP